MTPITLSAGNASVQLSHTDLSEMWWLLHGAEARLRRESPERTEVADLMKSIRERINTVYQEALWVDSNNISGGKT